MRGKEDSTEAGIDVHVGEPPRGASRCASDTGRGKQRAQREADIRG